MKIYRKVSPFYFINTRYYADNNLKAQNANDEQTKKNKKQ